MTGPIKPPSGMPPTPLAVPTTGPVGVAETRFRDVAEATKTDAARPVDVSVDPVVAALREGRTDAKGAVDALVARALESELARGLTPAGRVALEQHLRSQLTDDPAFARLVKDLG